MKVGIIGAGTMGNGIAQVAAMAGHPVVLLDQQAQRLEQAAKETQRIFDRKVAKGKFTSAQAQDIQSRIVGTTQIGDFKDCGLTIEAIVEDLAVKKQVFAQLEGVVAQDSLLATNTSSLSIASIASACQNPSRVLGIHFFNPAPLMPLVEVVPALQTDAVSLEKARTILDGWGKTTVLAQDTPGFIVNRVARPFYGEALRLLEEGMADIATIDWAMTEIGGFRMGPFTLMDFIGNDVNYTVTETVFRSFFYDPRYKPSFTQKRLAEAGYWGKKTGKGYYDYSENATNPEPRQDYLLGQKIFRRILVMLINEAADALFLNVANREDLDLAMTKGVNYPKGLLQWADELAIAQCVADLDDLYEEYLEDRYRCSPMLRRMAKAGQTFY